MDSKNQCENLEPDFNMNLLLSNIVSQKPFSNCRLCLKEIREEYVRFHDSVSVLQNGEFQPLSEVLDILLKDDEKVTEEIPGIDAICTNCMTKTVDAVKFILKCKQSTELLNRIFDNIIEALQDDSELTNNRSLYIALNDSDISTILILRNENDDEKLEAWNDNGNKKQRQFQCLHCNIILDNIDNLKDHNETCHDILTCTLCYETFFDHSELEIHVSTTHRFQCSKCKMYKNSEEDLVKHMDRMHKKYLCKECGKCCQGLDKLRSHEQKHVTRNECPKCGKSYATKDFFIKHVKLCLEDLIDPHPIRSNIKKTFICSTCNKGYSTVGGLRVHMRFVHGNAKPHICNYCGKKFTAPSYLKTHLIKHTGEKNFKCDICSNRFVSKEALLYHTRRHTGEKPYSCTMCNERFVNASARADHIRFRHVGPTLSCHICSRKFVTSHFLKQHLSRHHDPASRLYKVQQDYCN
ncbi:gastrula zinc finger protein XlCGF57.1-like isoform X2 [Achroia grisella]|uniref:gastrula zinc finger protein XlCGF57.1-like isoform X2 n=1 Tax=Achroia grisella TaxID=688607 RepID=UPI0027D23D0F|nr:gastrula zinc finger protein XlCGF57.1-like isoform X2 [Achroia grisella]